MAYSPSSPTSSAPFLTRSSSPRTDSLESPRHSVSDHEAMDSDDLEVYTTRPGRRSPSPPYVEKYSHNAQHSSSPFRNLARRPRVLAIAAILVFLVVFALFSVLHVSKSDSSIVPRPEVFPEHDAVDYLPVYPPQVRGAPTHSFRDNLRDDTKYITSWINAGWTNDVMTYFNLIYMGVLTNRTVVLPPFVPSHLGSSAGFVNVSEVLDLPRLSAASSVPIIEWSDIKIPGSENLDELGCWSIWATASTDAEKKPRYNVLERNLKLDVSYTPVPNSAILLPRPQYQNDPHSRFFSLATLTFPDGRERARLPASAPFPAPGSGHTALPDEQFACFDFPYYVSSEAPFEFNYDWSPAWRFVGTHAHWNPRLERVTLDMIRQTFGTGPDEEIPPFISMHVRHGDFGRYCQDEENKDVCFAPLSAINDRVEEVRAELREKKGIEVEKVLVTSDERDPEWWAGVREIGWQWIDHEELKTEENFGKWYPVFIDAVVQSLGAGFVGTARSTMSLIAQRRVEDWSGGFAREVPWGRFAN